MTASVGYGFDINLKLDKMEEHYGYYTLQILISITGLKQSKIIDATTIMASKFEVEAAGDFERFKRQVFSIHYSSIKKWAELYMQGYNEALKDTVK